MFKKILLPILIIAIALVGFKYLSSTKTERKKPQIKETVWQVDVIDAQLQTLAPQITFFSTIESPSLYSAAAPAEGEVDEILVKVGNKVTKGQVLLRLEAHDFESKVQQAKADVLDIEAQLKQLQLKHEVNQKILQLEESILTLTKAELNRAERVQKRGLGSESGLTTAQSAHAKQQLVVLKTQRDVTLYSAQKQQLDAKALRLNSRLKETKKAQSRSVVRADFDATIVSVDVSVGDRVKTSQILLSLYSQQNIEAKTRVPARYQPEIQQLLQSGVPVEAVTTVAGNQVKLQLDRLAGRASVSGIEVYFKVIDGQQWLRLGNFLKLKVNRAKQENVVALPLKALYGTSQVYLVEEGRLKGVQVETLGQHQNSAGESFILVRGENIQAGEKIVTTHLPNAISGLKVSYKGDGSKPKGDDIKPNGKRKK